MLVLHPGYAGYIRGTGMFLPGNPGGRVYALLFGGVHDRCSPPLAIGSSTLALLLAGVALHAYTWGISPAR